MEIFIMSKKLFISLLAMVALTFATVEVQAASAWDKYNNAKQKLQQVDAKVIQTQNAVTNAKSNTSNTIQQQKETRKATIQKEKTTALKAIQNEINAKNAEIANVKKATMLETERKFRLKKLEAELKSIKNRYSTTEKLYNKRLEALK